MHPDHQKRGIGDAIIKRLVARIHERAPERASIGLFAATVTTPFYERHGYIEHEALLGMFQMVQAGRDEG